MQAQLLNTRFHSNTTGNGTANPAQMSLKAGTGFKISKVEFLGGDSVDPSNVGKTACDQDSTLCTNPADAGGAIDWDRVPVSTNGAYASDVMEVAVSFGSRGGCTISSAKHL